MSRSEGASAVLRRVLLKLSGEALAGATGSGLDSARLSEIAAEVGGVVDLGVSVGIVVGGGNFFRGAGADTGHMDRIVADHIGMLATAMNALALGQALEAQGVPVRVQSALPLGPVAEPYVRARALKHLDKGRVVVFAFGTGNPLFTTDSAASLRGIEMGAQLMLKATKVDGVYSADPVRNAHAVRYERLSYDEVLTRGLSVMDATAVALCRDHKLPIRVFDIGAAGSLSRIVCGAPLGTLVSEGASA